MHTSLHVIHGDTSLPKREKNLNWNTARNHHKLNIAMLSLIDMQGQLFKPYSTIVQ